jgi:hypothetical protein
MSGYANINNPANYQLASFGQFGFRLLNVGDSGLATEQYRVLYALENSTITVVSSTGDSLTSQPVLAGTSIYGLFTSVTADAGTVLAYIA